MSSTSTSVALLPSHHTPPRDVVLLLVSSNQQQPSTSTSTSPTLVPISTAPVPTPSPSYLYANSYPVRSIVTPAPPLLPLITHAVPLCVTPAPTPTSTPTLAPKKTTTTPRNEMETEHKTPQVRRGKAASTRERQSTHSGVLELVCIVPYAWRVGAWCDTI